jgi:hypothetical protein
MDRLSELLPRVSPPASPGVAALVCSADPTVLDEIGAQVTVEISDRPVTAPR